MITKAIIPMLALFLVMPILSFGVVATPTVSIEPDINIEYGETTYVNGTGFANNTSYRIGVVFPTGVTVDGVSNGYTDEVGNFTTTLTLPNVDGEGYIRVDCGNYTISTLVRFNQTQTYEAIEVIRPDEPNINEYSIIHVEIDGLSEEYYILKVNAITPTYEEEDSFWVLHNGQCDIPYLFTEEGRYNLEITVNGTALRWQGNIVVGEAGINDDDDDVTPTTNITWNLVKAENVYTVNIFESGSGYVQTGTIRVIKPDGTITDIPIVAGSATITATTKGTYQLQFTLEGSLFLKSIDYSPQATLSISGFSNGGETSLTYTIDGKTPTEAITVQVSSESGSNTLTLLNGMGSFTTTQVGSYSFSTTYMGVTTTASATYSDTFRVEDFSAMQSSDTEYLIITGKVVGINSGSGKANAKVNINIESIGYSGSAKTGETGTFRLSIPLNSGDKGGFFGGATVSVSYDYGDDSDSTMVTLDRDWFGDYWLLWVFVVVLLIFVAKEKGIIYKVFRVLPPRGQKRKDDGATFDDPFF